MQGFLCAKSSVLKWNMGLTKWGRVCYNVSMKNYKSYITFLALTIVILPTVSFADGIYYSGSHSLIEAAPVRTVGTTVTQNSGTTLNVVEPLTINTSGNILGINIKSKAERDAEKAQKDAQLAREAEEARIAKNNDGTFAYGYTNGSGAQYTSGARYVDARETNLSSRYTASAGSANNGNFLPSSFGGWILTIILLTILVAIFRAFRNKFGNKSDVAMA